MDDAMQTYPLVVLGGGMVAGYAARAFVEEGVEPGRVAIVSAEAEYPYERPPLSKGYLLGKKPAADLLTNDREFYAQHGIDVHLNSPVHQVDFERRELATETGSIGFGCLLIATGSRVRKLGVPGADNPGVHYLRRLGHARSIREAAEGASRAVVVGGSFIGMEVASGLSQLGLATTLLYREDRVWERLFTPEMSDFFEATYRERGVKLVPRAAVEWFEGDGALEAVAYQAGGRSRSLAADLAVVGIGAEPNVGLFGGSNLLIEDGIVVDRYLETTIHSVFAAGDVARYPDPIFDRRRRVEHWDNAVSQAPVAARNMLGEREPYVHVPYFFSDVFDLSYEYWGDAEDADEIVHRGDVAGGRFSVWWLRDGRVQAAFVMSRPEEEREVAPEWIRSQARVAAGSLADADRALRELHVEVQA
jgi:NADPH-dependent 2,4-dienoyl-CoA reductase/sulfur reductase-like enzyme